jgi:putative hydrolase of the HAD superfamily
MDAVIQKASSLLGIGKTEFLSAFERAKDETKKLLRGTASSHSRLLYFQRTIEYLEHRTQLLHTLDLEQTYWRTFLANCILFPGLVVFLQYLKERNITTAIVTDLTSQIQFRKIIYFGLESYFDYVVTSEESGLDKPDLLPFRLMLDKIKITPDSIWMIGDSAEIDVIGAKKAGMVAIQKIHSGVKKGTGAGKAEFSFKNYSQLHEMVKKLAEK